MTSIETIAAILKTDKDVIANIEKHCALKTGKSGTLDAIAKENEELMRVALQGLGLKEGDTLSRIVVALENKVRQDEAELQKMFGMADFMDTAFGGKILQTVIRTADPQPGLFLKKQKAQEFIRNQPPIHIMECLGYGSVDDMLEKEDIMQIYAGLRFGEDREWLNTVFFRQYETLLPQDFEIRPIAVAVLDSRFAPLAKDFIEKKYHNISHLKEMGMLFIIPTSFNQPGQLMKVFSLLFHYCYEIPFYADLIVVYATDEKTFAKNIISLFKGDVPEPVIDLSAPHWLVVQRYLEKEDQNELLLMVPHVNPESLHWAKAQNNIAKVSQNLSFWNNLDWVGGFFKDEIGSEVLVTFNLVDVAMMLADKDRGKKYVYHQREALWNKLFVSYYGWEFMEKMMKDNILSGVIKL